MAKRDLTVKIDGDPKGFIAASRRSSAEAKKFADELDRLNKKKNLDGLTKAAADAGKSFGDLFGDIGSLGPAQVGLLSAAILTLPAVSALAAAGVTASLGGALATVGLVAAAQSAKVKGEFLDLKDELGNRLQDVAVPLERSLLRVPDVAREAFSSAEPELEGVFAKLAPHVDTFVARVGAGAAELEPALDPVADGFGALLDALGGRSDAIFGNLSDAVTELARTTEEHADDIASFVEGISGAVKGTATGVGWLADEWDRFLGDLEPAAEYFTGTQQDLDNSGAAAGRAAQQAADAAIGWLTMAGALDNTKLSADALQKELDELNASMDEDEAASRYQEALDQVSASVKRNGRTLSINTEKGRANRDAIRDMARAAQDHIVAMANEGAKVGTVSKTYSGYRRELYAALRAAGETKAGARKLVSEWLRVPKSVSTRVDAKTRQAQAALAGVKARLDGLNSKTLTITTYFRQIGRQANAAPRTARASGGYISGPGTGTSDSIPALLSNGEYVINSKSTRRHRELLEAINAGRFASGGIVRGYASGGMAGAGADVPIGEFVSRFMDGKTLSKADYAKVIRARRDAVEQLRRAERKLAEDRRKHRSGRTIADDEARVRKERRDLATATDKLSSAELRYRKSKLSPVQRLGTGLKLGIKNTGAFIKNIQKLADMGFGELAQQLLAEGGPEAEAMAAGAVKLSKSKLKALNKQVVTASKQQAKLQALPNVLLVKQAQKGGAKSVKDLMRVTGLSEEDIAAAFAAMGYARGGIERYARGGARRPGPGIATRPTVLFGEGRAPEAFIPYDPAHRSRAMGLVNQVAADLGMRRGGGSVTTVYNITVQGAIDPIGTARTVEKALRTLSRTNGRVPLEL